MKEINLTRGKVALVSDEDFEWLSQWKWHAGECRLKNLPSKWYARRQEGHAGPCILMHRLILERMGVSKKFMVDHIDGNGINNQRSNLRECSKSTNAANQVKRPGASSRFKGVYWYKRTEQWKPNIMCNGRLHSLGYFEDEEEAAMAYDRAAIKYFGAFAKLNFPNHVYD